MDKVILPVEEGQGISRRHFLIGSGAVVGATALFGATHLTPGQLMGARMAAAAQLNSDMDILMFALTLEHVEAAAYRAINASGLLSGTVAEYFRVFGEHERVHVVALTDVIRKLGGNPIAEQASYSFPTLRNQDEVVAFFAQVEEVGAGAYLGAAPLLQNKELLAAAAAIHNVEAQHASALRVVMNDPEPSPAFGKPLNYNEVIAAVGPLLQMPGGATGGAPGMPRTGTPDIGGPLAIVAGIFAAAFGAMLHIRSRGEQAAVERPEEA